MPLPTPNKYAVCIAKVLENYFLKTTLEPEGINEDVPAISFAGLLASASPIINSNGLYFMLLHLMFCALQNPSILYTSRKA